jgi:hypothetical protein
VKSHVENKPLLKVHKIDSDDIQNTNKINLKKIVPVNVDSNIHLKRLRRRMTIAQSENNISSNQKSKPINILMLL